MDDFGDRLSEVFTANIGRVVAFLLTPLLAVAVPPVVQGANEVLGTAYTDQQLSNVAIATVVGIAIVIWQWLRNRGKWEEKLAELEALYEAGKQNVQMAQGAQTLPDPPEGPASSALGMTDPNAPRG
jgi:hypothetical protein